MLPGFRRQTIIAAVATADHWDYAVFERFLLEHGLDNEIPHRDSVVERGNYLIRYLLDHPDDLTPEGANMVGAVVRDLIERAIDARRYQQGWFPERFPKLARALTVDGFIVDDDGQLRSAMPGVLGLPAADDEVHVLLRRFAFTVPEGHLDQALKNHGDGLWASANGQVRSFVYALIDEIADRLAPAGTPVPPPGGGRLNWLATLSPPFLLAEFNEWDGQGKGFFEAFMRRLQSHGAHPGLSEEEDATFRLHTALIAARLLLRRLAGRPGG
jgi:hypothetical protein